MKINPGLEIRIFVEKVHRYMGKHNPYDQHHCMQPVKGMSRFLRIFHRECQTDDNEEYCQDKERRSDLCHPGLKRIMAHGNRFWLFIAVNIKKTVKTAKQEGTFLRFAGEAF
jgi:hypothetical protein